VNNSTINNILRSVTIFYSNGDFVIIETVILGVIGNVTTQLFGKGYEKFSQAVQKDRAFIQIVDPVLKVLKLDEKTEVHKIEEFLRSTEVENVIGQIYSSEIIGKYKEKNIAIIKQEFKNLFRLHINIKEKRADEISDVLFEALFTICIKLYDENIKKGSLYAHDRLEQIRYQFIVNSLENLQENLKFLRTKDSPTIQQYLHFEKKYRQEIVTRYECIRPPHFETAEKIPLDQLYVKPNFSSSLDYVGGKGDTISTDDFISNIYLFVVLGDPGAGKTTFAQKICYDFGRGFGKSKYFGRDLTPILVVLRDYGIKLDSDGLSIIQYIEHISNSWYQESPPPGAFEYLLMNGRALVIFDGLDELLDTSKRQLISDNIESFSHHYPSVPILITSRKVGYEQAPLTKDRFCVFYIADFDDEQVEEYAIKWFTKHLEISSEEKFKIITSFLSDSLNVKDLRSNPLILSLMCDLYRGEGYIPKNRPDVYEKCSELLLKKWDKVRGVYDSIVLDTRLKPTLGHIAFEIYSNDKLLGGVTEKKLKEIAVDFLYPKYYESKEDAVSQAERFIEFSRGRAWVFSEIGSLSKGESLYQFTHRTFLEYFTAYHLVRNSRTPEDLFNFLLPKIIKREWDVVAQLAFQMKNSNTEDAGNDILTLILKETKCEDIKVKFNLISFSVRSLEFIVPSPSVIKEIVTNCFDLCIDIVNKSKNEIIFIEENITLDEIINPLLVADRENIKSIRKSIITNISDKINNSDDVKASIALKIFSSLPAFEFFFKYKGKEHLSSKINLLKLQSEIIEENREQIIDLCKKNRYNAIDGIITENLTKEDAVSFHGPGILFSVNALHGTYPILVSSIIDYTLKSFSERIKTNEENTTLILNEINLLIKLIFTYPLPWDYSTSSVSYNLISPFYDEFISVLQGNDLDTQQLFSLFTITAPLIEHDLILEKSDYLHRKIFNSIKSIDSVTLDPILFIFRARLIGYYPTDVDDLMTARGFNEKQKTIIIKWITQELKFLKLDEGLKIDKVDLTHYEVTPYY